MLAIRWARASRGLTPTQKFVLILLADTADEDGVCWNGARSLSCETGLSDRAVRLALHDLIEAGAISGTMRSGDKPDWKLNVKAGGSTYEKKRNGLPIVKRKHVPSNRKQVPISERNQIPSNRNEVPSKAEPVSVRAERGSDEPSLTPIEPSVTQRREQARAVEIPTWLQASSWEDWVTYRRSQKGWTEKASALCIRELSKLRDAGHDPTAVIEQSIASGWRGLFPLKSSASDQRAIPTKPRSVMGQWLDLMKSDQPLQFDIDGAAEELPQ